MKMLAVYDIADPRRLSRVAKIFKDYGIRVQYSKFELDPVGEKEFLTLQNRVANVIENKEDGVKYIPLCQRCSTRVEVIGQGKCIDPDQEFYIL
jgi:CRISPR-associated protein Cas2